MPKKIVEINRFNRGLSSTLSQTDTDTESAKYSLNIDPTTASGRLEGVSKDKALTLNGFKDSDNILRNIKNITWRLSDDYGGSFVDYGTLPAAHEALELTIDTLGNASGTVTSINDATLFVTSGEGDTIRQLLDNGHIIDGWSFFDNSGNIQYINNVVRGSTDNKIEFDTSTIRQTGVNVTSKILYHKNRFFIPGQAIAIRFDKYWFYVWLHDTTGTQSGINQDPELTTFNPGNNEEGLVFLGKSTVDIDFSSDRTNGGDNSIRTIVMTAIKNFIEADTTLKEFIKSTDGITISNTANNESISINLKTQSNINTVEFVNHLHGDVSTNAMTVSPINNTPVYIEYFNTNSGESLNIASSFNTLELDFSEFLTYTDKKNSNQVNLIGIKNNETASSASIYSIEDVYGLESVLLKRLGNNLPATIGEYSLLADDDKVHIGLGKNDDASPKIVMKGEENPLKQANDLTNKIYDAALESFSSEELSDLFSHYYIPPLHGTTPSATAISVDDSATPAAAFYPDYDVVADINGSNTLYTALTSGTYGTSGSLNGLKIGQIFKCHDTQDTNDNALVAWKKYDWNADATAVAAGDLFMYCGNIQRESGATVPVLRFLGNLSAMGGTPAFAYGIKDGDSSLYKISLVESDNHSVDEFDGTTTATLKDSNNETYTITNTGNRYESISLSSTIGGESAISSLTGCSSPTLFNRIGLAGEGQSFGDKTTQNVFYDNGHLQIYYRHGVFWIGADNTSEKIYKINAIDFHGITTTPHRIETIDLNFNNIPAKLEAENGDGMIRRTLEDQASSHDYDPKNQGWNRVPQDAHIIGLCETFESGRIKTIDTSTYASTWSSQGWSNAIKIDTWGNAHTSSDLENVSVHEEVAENSQLSRLTTGEVVRFAGLDDASPANKTFNSQPQTISVVDDGRAFFVVNENGGALNSNHNENRWWNSKLWVLYGRDNNSPNFKDWDLFLYNANTVDYREDRKLQMADRTVPYHQARYYTCDANPVRYDDIDDASGIELVEDTPSFNKIYYPGESAFIRKITTKSEYDASSHEATHFIKPTEDITCNFSNDSAQNSSSVHEVLMEEDEMSTSILMLSAFVHWDWFSDFGIYDKSGRWTTNGKWGSTDDMKFGNPCSDDVYGDVTNQALSIGGGTLSWGNNIGWDIDDGRSIKTVNNSLHPKVLYSSTYMANILYKGRRFQNDIQTNPVNHSGVSDDLNNALSNTTYNTPSHSVTFLGFTTGNFVVNPGDITRRKGFHEVTNWVFTDEDIGGLNIGGPKNGFAAHYNNSQYIKNYNNDLTLYTIDDFSGHRGSVQYTNSSGVPNTASTSLTLSDVKTYTSGVELARPNYGGPEIENPNYHPYDTELQYPYSSVNHGYYDESDPSTNKGWDGYTPPYLFNPGKGYYVYINRTWKSSSNHTPALEHHSLKSQWYIADSAIHHNTASNDRCWNFNYDADNVHINQHSNRRANFSSTCIADCITNSRLNNFNIPNFEAGNLLTNGMPANYVGQDIWQTTNANLSNNLSISDMLNNPPNYRKSRFSFWDYDNKYAVSWSDNNTNLPDISNHVYSFGAENQNIPVAVCTFNKINLGSSISRVNNVSPVIFKSEYNNPSDSNYRSYDYNQSYLCGVDLDTGDSTSGVAIIRTNFDAIYDKMLRDTSFSTSSSLDGNSSSNGFLFKNETTNINGDIYGDVHVNPIISFVEQRFAEFSSIPFDYFNLYLAKKDTDTSLLETINLTTGNTNYVASSISDADSLQMRQVALDIYGNTKIRDGLTLFGLTPMIPEFNSGTHALSHDWIYHTLNASGDKLYLGLEENAFAIDDPSTSSDAEGKYFEDSGGTFFAGAELYSSDSDTTLFVKSDNFVTITGSTDSNGTLAVGTYHYKFSFEYDGQYESTLNTGTSLSFDNVTDNANHIYIKLELPQTKIDSLSQRISGVSIYRKVGGLGTNDDDTYYFVKNVTFKSDEWYKTSGGYAVDIYDKGNLGPSYESLNGLPQNIHNASLNYGLSTSYQGYMYISKASHPTLGNVERYIFRSQPDNYFSFDYTKDYVIMPETPIAMTSFNSRIYVWGKNKLYKIDPFSLIIEDEFEGISIASKNSYVKTEFGLCFLDMNNIYLHDGNKPNPIGDPILYSSSDTINYETDSIESDGYVLIEQGYKNLIQTTIDNNDIPNVYYLGRKNAFVINLSDTAKKGKGFIFNISQNRWDLWDAPRPKSVSSSKDADILINDGNTLWNYLDSESKMYSKYNKRLWSWFSKDLTMEANNVDKVFRGFTFLGTPSIYNYANDSVAVWDTSSGITNSIQVYVDNEIVIPKIQNKLYETTNIANSYLADYNISDNQTTLRIKTPLNTLSEGGGVDTADSNQTHFRPGHLIKIDDEIMLITAIEDKSTYSILTVIRAQMGTTATSHTNGTSNIIKIVSPRFKLPPRSKGKTISIRLLNQAGYIDSIGLSYKPKSVKF